MKKALIILLAAILISACAVSRGASMAPPLGRVAAQVDPVRAVEAVSVAVLAYFPVPAEQAAKIIERLRTSRPGLDDLTLFVAAQDKNANAYVTYIGAGTFLRENHILTAAHLCYSTDAELRDVKPIIWVLVKGFDHPVRASVAAMTIKATEQSLAPDYAVLKLEEDPGRPGVKISERAAAVGDPVIFSGSVKGTAFFLRCGRATAVEQFLRRDEKGALHLTNLFDEPHLAVYPAGPGDSGGGIFNASGELVGVMFAGLQIASEYYVVSNSLASLTAFLKANKLEHLAAR